jgi:hypothetical protein
MEFVGSVRRFAEQDEARVPDELQEPVVIIRRAVQGLDDCA